MKKYGNMGKWKYGNMEKRKIMENLITKIVEMAGADKVMHFLACMTAAMAACVATGSAVAGTAAVGVGVGKEIYDRLTGEEFDWRDVAADAAGAVAGAAAWALMEMIGH